MRLTALALQRYGPFEDARVTLDPAPGRLTLLVARNGAGKSVLRQAFSDLLFGIHPQTGMDFRFGYAGMSLRAELLGTDGTPAALVRRKGQGNTLADAGGQPVPPGVLGALLGRADRRLLERLFSLDTQALRAGADELLATGGELGEALLAATGELHTARGQLDALDRQRDEVAPLRRSERRPFYRGLDALAAARRARREVRRPEEWRRREEAAQAEAAQAEANTREAAASARLAQLERVRRTGPLLAECDAAQAWLAAHPDAPALPEGEPQRPARRLADGREAQARAADALAEAGRRREAAAQAAAQAVPDAALLGEAEALAGLAAMAGAARQAEGDLPAVAGENVAAMARIAGLLRALGAAPDVTAADGAAAALVPSRPARAEAARLIERHGELAGQVERLPGLLAARAAERAGLAAALAALPGPPAPSGEPLEPLLREVGREGDPGALRAAVAARLGAARAAAATALARLPGGRDDVPPLAAAPAALEHLLDRLEAARGRAGTAREAAEAERERLARLREELAAATAALAQDGAGPPDDAALAAARRRRDAGWHLVFRHGFTPAPPDVAELAAWAGDEPLPLAYARAVAAADRLADRRAAAAQGLAEAAALAREETQAQASLDAARAEAATAGGEEAAALSAWLAAAAPLGLDAGTTRAALLATLSAREAALAALAAACLARSEADALARRQAAWAARLARAIPAPELDDLPALLALAEAQQGRARLAEAERARLDGRLQAVEAQVAILQTELAAATRTLEGWGAEWASALRALGRPPGEPPHATATALGLLGELETAVADAAQREERQAGMRARLARFGDAAVRLAGRVGGRAEPGADPFALARELDAALTAARRVQARRDELDRALAAAVAEQEGAGRALREAGGALAAVLAAVGGGGPDEAAARLALAEEAQRHRTLAREAAARLLEAGDGLDAAALRAAAVGIDREALPAAAEAARSAQREAAEAAQQAARSAALLREALGREAEAEPQAAAAEAAALAGIGAALEDALLLHAAGALLRHGLQRLEAEADTTLVRRIGAALAALTAGDYDGVALEPGVRGGAGTLVLREHAHPHERRLVEALSEGTRDQLYLALRLVAIEDHVRAAPALPFLADDILQTFDDRRARATLQALVGLSRSCQVVVLTHHEHLVGLAEGLPVHLQRL